MNVTITFGTGEIDQSIEAILGHKATAVGKTVNEYVEEWVRTWGIAQIRAYYEDKARELSYNQAKAIFGPVT